MSSGVFGDDFQDVVLYGLTCSGNETGVLECSSSDTGSCPDHSAAVICQGWTPVTIVNFLL